MWLADGTFKVVPSMFFQLYTIHFAFGNGVCPAAIYCLLTDKSAATYQRLHHEVKNLIPTIAPSSILVDFEKATMNTFSAAYTSATLRGCYFHFCQSVMHKVSDIGLKAEYESNEDARTFIHCLPDLAFVPPEDVLEAFDLLANSMPHSISANVTKMKVDQISYSVVY